MAIILIHHPLIFYHQNKNKNVITNLSPSWMGTWHNEKPPQKIRKMVYKYEQIRKVSKCIALYR
jgi:hypothetical protein